MQLSLNWLKEYVKIPKKITPEELASKLSLQTVEVENIRKQEEGLVGVVVGEIVSIKKHPNADKLSVAQVKVGEKKPRQIIFGQMAEIKIGYKVPVALAPTVLFDGKEIKRTELRGEASEGMLCLDQELGLLQEGVSIHFFDKKIRNGTPITKALELNDIIFEIDNKSLSNRPDLWCHYGMAREIAAMTNSKLKPISEVVVGTIERLDKEGRGGEINLKVKVEDQKLCPRYMAVAMTGIKVGKSPKWMQKRLMAAGMRPINNIVDATNYVMLELGQPLHAFDASLVKVNDEHKITVRKAKKGEIIETLDGEARKLDEDMLVIANKEKPLAVAGVMGGAGSEINNETAAIIIESANFDAVSVRKTSGRLGLRTESSMRFEKSLDPNLCEAALIRAVELVKQTCPTAKAASEVSDIKNFIINQGPVRLDVEWLAKKIGVKVPTREIIKILNNLGFKVEHSGRKLSVTVPTWRATKDISIPEDVAEEVARIYGYEKIIPAMPRIEMKAPEINKERTSERKIKEILTGAPALSEVYNYSFVGEEQLRKLNLDASSYVKIINPIASDLSLLRQSLTPNLLNNARANQAKFELLGLFEIGNAFFAFPGNINKDNKKDTLLPHQEKMLGIVLAGDSARDLFSRTKGIIEYLFNSLNLPVIFRETESKPSWAGQGMSAAVVCGGKAVGIAAALDSQTGRRYGLKKEAVITEINFKDLCELAASALTFKYSPIEKFPPVARDAAFVVDGKILYNDIKAEIAASNPLLKAVELFDVYEGEKIGVGKRNLAFHLVYRADDRTLTAEEVDDIQKKLIKRLEEKFGAKVRDF